MRALLDGDIYAFRSAAASEHDDVGIAIWRMEEMIENTLAAVRADSFSIFLSGDNNFRYEIYPEYKGNRPKERPKHLAACKSHLIEKYSAEVSDGCEADDLLGIAQCKDYYGVKSPPNGPETIICSLDKDLLMIPGHHYSWEISGKSGGTPWTRPEEFSTITELEGTRRFYTQVLTGDTTDNVRGAAGIGKVKAGRILADCTTEQQFVEAVRACFSCDEELEMTGACLWIFRKPNDIWKIPKFT